MFKENLEKEYTITFSTPVVKILHTLPSGRRESSRDHATNALIVVVFDQLVDAEAVLKTVKMLKKKSVLPSRFATPEEIKQAGMTALLKDYSEGQFIVFTSTKQLPYNTKITVKIGPGLISKEGPAKSTDEKEFWFVTCENLKVKGT